MQGRVYYYKYQCEYANFGFQYTFSFFKHFHPFHLKLWGLSSSTGLERTRFKTYKTTNETGIMVQMQKKAQPTLVGFVVMSK